MSMFRRSLLLAGVLVGLAGLGGPAGTAGAASSGDSVTLRGTYQLLVADTVADRRTDRAAQQPTHHERSELRAGGKTYQLRLPAGTRLRGGTGISVTGILDGDTLTATSVTPLAALTESIMASPAHGYSPSMTARGG